MNLRRLPVLVISVCVLATCIGCSTVPSVKVPYEPGAALNATRPCPVTLRLNETFTKYNIVGPGNRWQLEPPLGPELRKYAIYVAQSVFGDVQVLDGQPQRSDAKIVLVPRVTNTDLIPHFHGVVVASGNLGVRWDFLDPKTGQKLFSTGIQAEASHISSPNDLPWNEFPYVVHDLLTDLTDKTIQRFNMSQDIRRLTGH